MPSIFGRDVGEEGAGRAPEASPAVALAWALPPASLVVGGLIQWLFSFFAPGIGLALGVLIHTVAAIGVVFTSLNIRHLGVSRKLMFFLYACGSWMFGMFMLLIWNLLASGQRVH